MLKDTTLCRTPLDEPVAETSTWQHTKLKQTHSHAPAGFEPAIPASERPQTHALDRAANGRSKIYNRVLISYFHFTLAGHIYPVIIK